MSMEALTIHVRALTAVAKGYQVALLEGPPGANGAVIATADVTPTAEQEHDLHELRALVLSQTGRIKDIDRRAETLGDLLLPGDVGLEWKRRIGAAKTALGKWRQTSAQILKNRKATAAEKAWAMAPPGLRTYVNVEVPGLGDFPLEVMRCDGAVFLRADTPVTRYRSVQGREPAPPDWQVRILIVLATDDPRIEAVDEARAIRRAVRAVDRIYDAEVLTTPTRDALRAALKAFKPRILHFIGHGSGSALQMVNSGAGVPWGPSEIEQDISASTWIPEFVYLNACRSQGVADATEATPNDQTRQQEIVHALFKQGVQAAIAMQADVRGSAAATCARAFYTALAEGADLDVACATGRLSISTTIVGGTQVREPYLPVLMVTVPADQILRHRSTAAPAKALTVMSNLRTFVDRNKERRQIVEAFDAGTNVIVLSGPEQVGKSFLFDWCADLCSRRQHPLRYLELGACADWLEVFRLLRQGGGSKTGLSDPLGPILASSFNWRLSHLAKGRVDPPGVPAAEERDTAGPLKKLERSRTTAPEFCERVAKAFHEAITLSEDQRLVIVLDHLKAGDVAFSASQFASLRNAWIDRLVAAGDGRVMVLLGIRDDQLKAYGLEVMPHGYEHIEVGRFPPAVTLELLDDLIRLKLEDSPKHAGQRDAIISIMSDRLPKRGGEATTGKELDDYAMSLLRGYYLDAIGGPS